MQLRSGFRHLLGGLLSLTGDRRRLFDSTNQQGDRVRGFGDLCGHTVGLAQRLACSDRCKLVCVAEVVTACLHLRHVLGGFLRGLRHRQQCLSQSQRESELGRE